ncbi:MAG: ImmA/IrrE family metallo-endopeptidase [Kiritimatiellia bacterium]
MAKQKRLSKKPGFTPDGERGEAANIGAALRDLRIRRGLRQIELAALAEMNPGQISVLEHGHRTPSLRTFRRVCEALGTTPDDLLRVAGGSPTTPPPGTSPETDSLLPGLRELFETPEEKLFAPLTRRGILRTTRLDSYAAPLPTEETITLLEQRIFDYLRVETLCGAFRKTSIPLTIPFRTTTDGAESLAAAVRSFLGIGDSVILDSVSLLENRGIRILFLELPHGAESFSFYDRNNSGAFFVVNSNNTPEKQLFRIALELAYLYLFIHNGEKPVFESAEANRRFAKYFAACFLLPRNAILFIANSLGTGRGDWTYPLVLRIKRHFGVSAEAFCYRLLELNQIHESAVTGILASIRGFYETHQNREPGETLPSLLTNSRLADLIERARSIPGAFDEVRTIARHAGLPFAENTDYRSQPQFFGFTPFESDDE